jgi:hypothetical protein
MSQYGFWRLCCRLQLSSGRGSYDARGDRLKRIKGVNSMTAPSGDSATLQSLSGVPNDPQWRFPSLGFDKDGYVLPAPWLAGLLTEDQRKFPPGAIVDQNATKPGAATEEWNQFQIGNWEAMDDAALAQQILDQNDVPVLMAAIRGH